MMLGLLSCMLTLIISSKHLYMNHSHFYSITLHKITKINGNEIICY